MTRRGGTRLAAAIGLAGLLAGCAGTHPYRATTDRNVRFTTAVDSGSAFSSLRASVHVHSIDGGCRTSYEGTIALGEGVTTTGIPTGQPSYLVVAFDRSAFLANSRSNVRYSTLLTPRPGHDYEIAVTYVDDSYNATVREVNRRTRARRDVSPRRLESCRRSR